MPASYIHIEQSLILLGTSLSELMSTLTSSSRGAFPLTVIAIVFLIFLIASRFSNRDNHDKQQQDKSNTVQMIKAPLIGKGEWQNMNLIVVGCIKGSVKEERIKVQANLDLLASMWSNVHFVIYADAASKEVWSKETKGRQNQTYHFILDAYKEEVREFNYFHEARIYRLMNGRNTLLKKTRQIVKNQKFKHNNTLVAVLDLDDMNIPPWKPITIVHSMARINEWDVVSYNRPYYYDIWALRSPGMDINCWGPGIDNGAVILNMRADITQRLSKESMLEVYSAFNALAIYKYQFLHECHYSYVPNDLDHPPLHLCIRNKGGRVRIFNETIIDEFYKGPH